MAPLLDVRNLQIRFGDAEAVRGINFAVNAGEVLGLVGESGSGKSATALAILGLLGAAGRASGEIRWHASAAAIGRKSHEASGGINLLQQAPESMRRMRGQDIAMIFQEPMTALNPVMSV